MVLNPDLAKKLLKMDENTFKLAGEIFVNTEIKFCQMPIFKPTTFNVNLLKEMNTTQLKFLMNLVNQELKKREE